MIDAKQHKSDAKPEAAIIAMPSCDILDLPIFMRPLRSAWPFQSGFSGLQQLENESVERLLQVMNAK